MGGGLRGAILQDFSIHLNQNNIMYREWMDLPVDVMAHFTSGAISLTDPRMVHRRT